MRSRMLSNRPRGPARGPSAAPPATVVATGEPSAAEVNALIARAMDPLALMQRVADHTLAMIAPADGVQVCLVVDGSILRCVCGAGQLRAFVGQAGPMADTLSGRAISSGQTMVAYDVDRDVRVAREAARTVNVRSSVSVPLGRGAERVGVLNVSSERARAF